MQSKYIKHQFQSLKTEKDMSKANLDLEEDTVRQILEKW